MAASFVSIFGDQLLTKSGELQATSTLLDGKPVLIYFSAHWCPPCRRFTPDLVAFYHSLKTSGANFEIVFVSSDKDQKQFNEYYGEMPWLSLPFDERDKKTELSRKYGVQGIPTLIVLDSNGNIITKKGREKVSEDKSGSDFPWYPRSFNEEFGTSFLGKNGVAVDRDSFAHKNVALYFSAHWCPPCRNFTPKLVEYYNKRKASGKDDLEIVFVSADNSEKEFNEYFGSMPWLAIPPSDARIARLNSRFEVEGIPHLVILDPHGNVLCASAVSRVSGDPDGKDFPYPPSPVEDIEETMESYGFDINSKPSLIAFLEPLDDGEQDDAIKVLKEFGEDLARDKIATADGPEMLFFFSKSRSRIGDAIRSKANLPGVAKCDKPILLILDIPDNGGFYKADDITEVTKENVNAFIGAFRGKTIPRLQLV